MKQNSSLSVLWKGILKENPVFVLILGTCPTLAQTTNVIGAIGVTTEHANFKTLRPNGLRALDDIFKRLVGRKCRSHQPNRIVAGFGLGGSRRSTL